MASKFKIKIEDNFSVVLKEVGEAGTTAVISGASSSEGPVANPVQGIWKGNYVYSGTYVWNVALRDRAGNVSSTTSVSYITKAAPILTSYSLSDSSCTASTAGKLLLPYVGSHNINSGWGSRGATTTTSTEFHFGYDYDLKTGEDVISAGDGTILNVLYDTYGGGNMVTIDHGNGLVTWYAHLSQQLAVKGARVTKGTVIGKSGNSGMTTGPHLHFQVMLNGVAHDPKEYLYNCDKVPQPEILEGVNDTSTSFVGNKNDPWNGKTYADIVKEYGLKNTVDIRISPLFGNDTAKYKVIDTPRPTDTKSVITSIDTSDENKIVIYGIAPPPNSTWTYNVHREVLVNECVISGWVCTQKDNNRTIDETITVVNSSIQSTVHLVEKAALDSWNGTIAAPKPVPFADVVVTDPSGRWSTTFTKVSDNVYKPQNSNVNVTLNSKGVSLVTYKTFTFDPKEIRSDIQPLEPTLSLFYDFKSNLHVVSPTYKYTAIDQNLYVTGDWKKNEDAYYDRDYLDTRVVKLLKKTEPTSIKTINLFAAGWDPDGPTKIDRSSPEFTNWINLFDIKKNIDSIQLQMAQKQSQFDPDSLNLAISWPDASVDKRFFGKNVPTEAAKWIVPVADKIAKHLISYLSTIPTIPAINCTGHSLGSLLCNEIGISLKKYNSSINVNKLVALDAPAEYLKYNLDGINGKSISTSSYFSGIYNTSVSFYGVNSTCGNSELSKSANIAIAMKFDDVIDICNIHGKVPESYYNMMNNGRNIPLPDMKDKNLLSLTINEALARGDIDGIASVNLLVYMFGSDNRQVGIAVRKNSDGKIIVYSSNGTSINYFHLEQFRGQQINIYQGSGFDKYYF